MLSYSDILPLSIMLRTIAHLPESLHHVGINVMTANLHSTLRWRFLGNNDLHRRGFASAIVTQ